MFAVPGDASMRQVFPSLFLLVGTFGAVTAAETASTPPPAADPAAAAGTDETLIVTADRQDNTRQRTTATVDVLTAEDVRDRGHPQSAWTALAGMPGVDVLGTSGGFDGGTVGIHLRGGHTEDTQILVDGIPVNDASDPQGNANLALISTVGLDQIEVVRGGQSGLYGSRATTGVINLLTQRPTATPEVRGLIEGGSFGTARGEVQASGPLSDRLGYAVALGGLHSDGFSSKTDDAADGRPGDHERDGVDRLNANARIEAVVAPGTTVFVAGRSDNLNQDYDGSGTNAPEAPNHAQLRSQRLAGGADGAWDGVRLAATAARTWTGRTYTEPAAGDSRYLSTTDFASAQVGYDFLTAGTTRTVALDRLSLTAGADHKHDAADISTPYGTFTESERIQGAWSQLLAGDRYAEASATARGDWHSREGRIGTWRTGLAIFPLPERVKVFGSVGTTFRAPTLFELYDAYAGNPNLAPQRALSSEVGHETTINELLTFGNTWFQTAYQESIDFDPNTYTYVNGGAYRIAGIENSARWNATGQGFRLRVSYTAQRTDLDSGEIRAGRALTSLPEHKGMLSPAWAAERWWLGAQFELVGRREATVFSSTEELHGYCLIGAEAGYVVAPGWEVYVRGENLSNTAYVVNPGYSTAPIAGYAGLTAAF
jgi:vitamin B12 transporter